MLEGLKKFFLSKVLRRHYYRTGKCKACGKCCTQIYVKHYKHVVQDEKEFEKLQYLHRFYTYLKIIGKDDIGLIFECQNLDPETHKCKIHKSKKDIDMIVISNTSGKEYNRAKIISDIIISFQI